MLAGIWTHRDLVEDFYSLEDLLDAHEMLDLKAHNDSAFQVWRQSQNLS